MSISVFVADDHSLLAKGVERTLAGAGMQVLGVAHSPETIAASVADLKPNVVFLDIRFDNTPVAAGQTHKTGLDVCVEILAQDPLANIVVYSQFDSPYLVEEVYRLGARAFVRKDESIDVTIEAVTAAAEGKTYYSPEGAMILGMPSGCVA